MTEAAEEVRPLPPVRWYPIGEIRESPINPRNISEEAVELVALSLRRFGWKQPVVVDGDGFLVVGHTRYRAARSLGQTRIPGICADDLTPEEVDAYRIADNRTRDFTTWDLPELAKQLDALAEDFSDVLALSNWQVVAAELDAVVSGGLDGGGLDLPPEVENALDGGFIVNVCFSSKEEALAAQEAIMELPGVFDVRHDF